MTASTDRSDEMTTETELDLNRIVVGVDGSEASKQALRWAKFLATTTGSSVAAVTAWTPPLTWAGPGWAVPPIAWSPDVDARKLLEDTVSEVFGDQDTIPITLTVREGGAAQVLLDLS